MREPSNPGRQATGRRHPLQSLSLFLLVAFAVAAPLPAWILGSTQMVVEPLAFYFSGQVIGTLSDLGTVSIHNQGDSSLNYSVTLSGENADDFVLSCQGGGTDCFWGTVPPHSTMQVFVRFAPTEEGARIATLTVTGDDPVNPWDYVDLWGTGEGIFANGFENGTTSAWSLCAGCMP